MRHDYLFCNLFGKQIIIEGFGFGQRNFGNDDLFCYFFGDRIEIDSRGYAIGDRFCAICIDDHIVCRNFGLRNNNLLGHLFRKQFIVDGFGFRNFHIGKNNLFRDLIGQHFIIEGLGFGQRNFGNDDFLRHLIGKEFVIDSFGFGNFCNGNDHLLCNFFGKKFIIQSFHNALRDLFPTFLVYKHIVIGNSYFFRNLRRQTVYIEIGKIGHFCFHEFCNPVIIDGIGKNFRSFRSLIYSIIIDNRGIRR